MRNKPEISLVKLFFALLAASIVLPVKTIIRAVFKLLSMLFDSLVKVVDFIFHKEFTYSNLGKGFGEFFSRVFKRK